LTAALSVAGLPTDQFVFCGHLVVGLHAVSHGYLQNILISEYIVFLYLIATFTIFLIEDQQSYNQLENLNLELERMVSVRTRQLQAASEMYRRLAADEIRIDYPPCLRP
jgi:hypothetical protein